MFLNKVDFFLDRITMYRLVLYILFAYIIVAAFFGAIGILPYSLFSIVISTLFVIATSWAANTLFARIYHAPTNLESVYITALILTLIITPSQNPVELSFIGWVGVLAVASKFILSVGKKHIFNPAAIALVITLLFLGHTASWWIGTVSLAPFVLVGGFLIIRKLRFEDLAWSFFGTVIVISLALSLYAGRNIFTTIYQIVFTSSFIFFGTVMLTEPLTFPPTQKLRIMYGVLVGFLSIPQVHIGSLYFSPELSLCIGNIFAYFVSPQTKLILTLSEKIRIAPSVMDFIFKPEHNLTFIPGQYMEWTLSHSHPDARGTRRYFTLASSPTEDVIRLGVKFYDKKSSYKNALLMLDKKTPIVASQIAGDFTLPNNKIQKLVFIAGGIGITPFRSMIKYLLDSKEKRNIILIYSNRTTDEIVYKDVFQKAAMEIGIKTIFTLTAKEAIPLGWPGEKGRITTHMIQKEIPDYLDRLFYISGPQTMIDTTKIILSELSIPENNIKTDYFPGLV